MKGLTKAITCSFLITLVSSCGGINDIETVGESVYFTDVLCPKTSLNSSDAEPRNRIINSLSELEGEMERIGYDDSSRIGPIDFSEGSLVLVYGGQRGTNNEWVTIIGVNSNPNEEILVKYNNFTINYQGCGGGGVVTYPFCIVQLDGKIESAEFESTELNSCDVDDKPELI